jgi:hypothetical protein
MTSQSLHSAMLRNVVRTKLETIYSKMDYMYEIHNLQQILQ